MDVARASLISVEVIVLPLILGTIIGPGPPPALTITGLLAGVPTPEAAFCPAASWLTALVRLASVLSSLVSWLVSAVPTLPRPPAAFCFC